MSICERMNFITHHALPLAMALLYLPQSVLVWYLLDDELARFLFYLVLSAIFFVYVGYAAAIWLEGKIRQSFQIYSTPIFCLFAVFVLASMYLIATSQSALWLSINGGSFESVANARELFTKYRSGGETIFVYLYALLLRSVVPLGLVWLFAKRSQWRYILLVLIIGLLLNSLEKMLPALVIMPLAAYYWLKGDYKKTLYFACLLFIIFFIATYFSTIHPKVTPEIQRELQYKLRSSNIEGKQMQKPRKADIPSNAFEPLVFVKNGNFMIEFNIVNGMNRIKRNFKPHNTFTKIMERALWTPFITAYDWLHLWKNHYGHFLKGRSIGIIAKLTGYQKINFDKEVHYYQYGVKDDANALYVADAYINFGFFAVAVYSILIGFFMGFLRLTESLEFISVSTIYAYALSISAVPPNLLSGGIGVFLLLLIACVFKSRFRLFHSKTEAVPHE